MVSVLVRVLARLEEALDMLCGSREPYRGPRLVRSLGGAGAGVAGRRRRYPALVCPAGSVFVTRSIVCPASWRSYMAWAGALTPHSRNAASVTAPAVARRSSSASAHASSRSPSVPWSRMAGVGRWRGWSGPSSSADWRGGHRKAPSGMPWALRERLRRSAVIACLYTRS